MSFATRYNREKKVGLICNDKSLTKQADAKDADINNIMKKYLKTGVLPNLIKQEPRYGDFSEVSDYLDSMNTVLFANEQFAALSAEVRKQFDNDPAKFLEFASNPENGEEMVKLGLAERKPHPDAEPDSIPSQQQEPKAPKSEASN